MKRKLFITTAILFVLAAGIVSERASAGMEFRVEGAGLEANPINYVGPCPGLIRFKGKIQANGAGRVKYTYSYSDGGSGPEGLVDFTGPGVMYVETTWRLGDATALPRFDGWATLKIISPNAYESNKAKFTLECRSAPTPPREQPQPGPAGSGRDESAAKIEAGIDKSSAAEKSRRIQKDRIIKSFADRIEPAIKAAEAKLGIDRKSIEAEAKAIAADRNPARMKERYEQFRQKYEPVAIKIYQEAGIDVAQEKRRLISELGLEGTRIKPSSGMTIDLNPEPANEVVPPASSIASVQYSNISFVPPRRGYLYNFGRPFTAAGVGGDADAIGLYTSGDRTTGAISASHSIGIAGSWGSSAWVVERFEAKPAERAVKVRANFETLGYNMWLLSVIAGYASTEASVSVVVYDRDKLGDDGIPVRVCESRKTLEHLIAVGWGFPSASEGGPVRLECNFTRERVESRYGIRVMVELYSGAGGFASSTGAVWGTLSGIQAETFLR